jgi:hypothetical protein
MVQLAAGRVNNNIEPTTGCPPRRENYTKAQGRRVEQRQRRKALDGLLYDGIPAARCRRTRVRRRQSRVCRGHCWRAQEMEVLSESCGTLPDDFQILKQLS